MWPGNEEEQMAKAKKKGTAKGEKITGARRKNITKAFKKNKQGIQKRFKKFKKNGLTVAKLEAEVLQLNGQLRDWLLGGNGEDPKATDSGRP
jgi:hypothetical protein